MKYSPSTRLPMSRPCMSVNATTTVSISPFLTAAPNCSLVSNSSLLVVAVAGPGDESFEEFGCPRQVASELLWVALDGDDQAVVRLQTFDGAIISGRRLPQPRRQLCYCLVVKAVDLDLATF